MSLLQSYVQNNSAISRILHLQSQIIKNNLAAEIQIFANSLTMESFRVLEDKSGRNVGWVIWGNVHFDTVKQFILTTNQPKYGYEWHEGSIIWIRSLHTVNGLFSKDVRKQLRQLFNNNIVFIPREKGCHLLYNTSKLIILKENVDLIDCFLDKINIKR